MELSNRYIKVKDGNGKEWNIEKIFSDFAKEHGWTSGVLDQSMAKALLEGQAWGMKNILDCPINFAQTISRNVALNRIVTVALGKIPDTEEWAEDDGYGVASEAFMA